MSPRFKCHWALPNVPHAPRSPPLRIVPSPYVQDFARGDQWRAGRSHPRVEQGAVAVHRRLHARYSGIPQGPRYENVGGGNVVVEAKGAIALAVAQGSRTSSIRQSTSVFTNWRKESEQDVAVMTEGASYDHVW